MEITLVRHGQSEANAGLTDALDSGLTQLGQTQAARTAERLHGDGLTRLYVSPLRRTLETIAPMCAATGLRAEAHADICEYFAQSNGGYHTFAGMTPTAIRAEFPFATFGDTFPDAWWPRALEDDDLMAARAVKVRDALLQLYAGTDEKLLIVSHAETVGRLIEAFQRIPFHPADPPWSENCGVSRLSCPADPALPAMLLFQNDRMHLAALES